jgi:threonine/homoserine/homoserine lactone efflux protein
LPVTLGQWSAFALAAAVVIVAPGPDNLATVSLGLSRGRKAAVAFGLGCGIGCVTHTTWAVLGVSALLAASAAAFTALKFAGAAYLFWLAAKALRRREVGSGAAAVGGGRAHGYFVRGLVANAINPKVALFFLAFLPQFVRPGGSVAAQMVVLGATFTALSAIAFAALGHFSGGVGRWLRTREGAARWLDRATAGLFVALGLRLVLAQR